jgi:hypothetical protein
MQAVGRHGLRREKGAMAPYEAVVGGHQHTTTTSGDGFLFSTDISNNVIELKNVILNEFHVLRKFFLIRSSRFACFLSWVVGVFFPGFLSLGAHPLNSSVFEGFSFSCHSLECIWVDDPPTCCCSCD